MIRNLSKASMGRPIQSDSSSRRRTRSLISRAQKDVGESERHVEAPEKPNEYQKWGRTLPAVPEVE